MLSKGFGTLNSQTNRWEGSIGDVAEGKADIGMSITIYQPDRAAVVSFLPPADEHLYEVFFYYRCHYFRKLIKLHFSYQS